MSWEGENNEKKKKLVSVNVVCCGKSVRAHDVCVYDVAEWLSSYALGLTTPGLQVQTKH